MGAIKAGFYDDRTTPALDALVFHEGVCRGYVMRCGLLNRRLNAEFFELVKARSQETGYFHVQFSACHTMLCDNKISLLDLEAVYPIAEYARMSHYHSVFDHPDYERYVATLYGNAFPEKDAPGARFEGSLGQSGGPSNSERPAWSFVGRLQSVPKRAWQRLRIRVGSFWPRTDLIRY